MPHELKAKTQIFGLSSMGLPILAWEFGEDHLHSHILILGGVHGDEIESVFVSWQLFEALKSLEPWPWPYKIILIPEFNKDGTLLKTRQNGNGVDLNRNLPTHDWSPEAPHKRYWPGPFANSEPENLALTQWLSCHDVKGIISLHSYYPMINYNGPSKQLANYLENLTGYPAKSDVGYPTPGSLGTYAGAERKIPTLTYELERGAPLLLLSEKHVKAIIACLNQTELWLNPKD